MRLAHFSDIHVTAGPFAHGPLAIVGKRISGTVNHYFARRRHFAGVDARIVALLDDVDAQSPGHAICTGDITQLSFDKEFDRAAELFGARLGAPERYTVLPGNHDRYTRGAGGAFEARFAALAGGGAYPFVKALAPGLSLVGIDVARPTGLTDSSGRLGEAQAAALERALAGLAGQRVVLALHYALFRSRGEPDRPRHGIRDWPRLLEIIEREGSPVRLVIHGHVHKSYALRRRGVVYACAGSATDLANRPGYLLHTLDGEHIQIHRRRLDPAAGRYVDDAPLPIRDVR